MYDFFARKIRDLKALTLIKECKQAHMNIMLPISSISRVGHCMQQLHMNKFQKLTIHNFRHHTIKYHESQPKLLRRPLAWPR
jgi:hypothetical protein